METNKEALEYNYQLVLERISNASTESNNKNCKLLTVSKKRSVEDIKIIYDLGQRAFGENYVAELIEKAEKLPKDIEWHLIGHLQTNKIKNLLETPNLAVIESVDSIKVATELNKACVKDGRQELKVYVEVNISGTETKTGAKIEIIDDIIKEIIEKCPKLKLAGIMSLGDIGNKEQFEKMIQLKKDICEKNKLDHDIFVCSFGTSEDFDEAIRCGSNEVRVGSSIFQILI